MNSRGKCDTKQSHLPQLRAATGQNAPTQDENSLRMFKICVVPSQLGENVVNNFSSN